MNFSVQFSDNSYFIISSLRIFPTSTHLVKYLLGRLMILFEFIKSLLQKRTKYLFTLPKTRLGSYNKILILSNFAAKQMGKETYPPRPNTKSGFSFLKSKKELNKARISFKQKNILFKNPARVGKLTSNILCKEKFFFTYFAPLLSVTNIVSYSFFLISSTTLFISFLFLKENFSILILGGSQGAEIFGEIIPDVILDLSKNYKINIILSVFPICRRTSKCQFSRCVNISIIKRCECICHLYFTSLLFIYPKAIAIGTGLSIPKSVIVSAFDLNPTLLALSKTGYFVGAEPGSEAL